MTAPRAAVPARGGPDTSIAMSDQPPVLKRTLPPPPARPIFLQGQLNWVVRGVHGRVGNDLYHFLLRASWRRLLAVIALLYLGTNVLFAELYLLGGPNLSNARDGSFLDAFAFSVQTLATIGYGAVAPATTWAHMLVTAESFLGMVGVAMGTGLLFAKFSRPTARVAFANVLVLHERNGRLTLSFRLANERVSMMVGLKVELSALVEEITREGHQMRRFVPLRLERDGTPVFALIWTGIHPIDEQSPLFGIDQSNANQRVVAILCTMTAIDDTTAQGVHARHIWAPDAIRPGHRFADMVTRADDDISMVDHTWLHETLPV